MLSDQGSPYVGRFARGWHRLPGKIPGQPQTRTRARSSIGRSAGSQERPSRHEERDCLRPTGSQRFGARGGRSSGREHIVDEQHVRRHGRPVTNDERSAHRCPPLHRVALGLGTGRDDAPKQASDGQPGLACDGAGQHLRLIEPSLGLASPGQRDPRHHVGAGWRAGGHRRAQGPPYAPHPSVLELMNGGAGGTLEGEGGPGARHRVGGTLLTPRTITTGRRGSASLTPRRGQRDQRASTPAAERPGRGAAPRAPRGEDDVERTHQHGSDDRKRVRHEPVRAGRPRAPGRRHVLRWRAEPGPWPPDR